MMCFDGIVSSLYHKDGAGFSLGSTGEWLMSMVFGISTVQSTDHTSVPKTVETIEMIPPYEYCAFETTKTFFASSSERKSQFHCCGQTSRLSARSYAEFYYHSQFLEASSSISHLVLSRGFVDAMREYILKGICSCSIDFCLEPMGKSMTIASTFHADQLSKICSLFQINHCTSRSSVLLKLSQPMSQFASTARETGDNLKQTTEELRQNQRCEVNDKEFILTQSRSKLFSCREFDVGSGGYFLRSLCFSLFLIGNFKVCAVLIAVAFNRIDVAVALSTISDLHHLKSHETENNIAREDAMSTSESNDYLIRRVKFVLDYFCGEVENENEIDCEFNWKESDLEVDFFGYKVNPAQYVVSRREWSLLTRMREDCTHNFGGSVMLLILRVVEYFDVSK